MKQLFFIALLASLVACSRSIERLPAPDNLIPREKMVTVLKEMLKLESHIQNQYGQVSIYYKVMEHSGDSLLSTFQLDREAYEASMDYYGSRQEEMKAIYSESLEQMNEELGELESE